MKPTVVLLAITLIFFFTLISPLNVLALRLKRVIFDPSPLAIFSNELEGVMKTRTGSELDPVEIAQDMGRIELYYEQKGYLFAKIKNYRIDDSGVVIVRISEGRVGNIFLKGSVRTKERVILQELLFKIGDIFNSELADESERILRRKPYLGQAEITASYDENNDYVNVQIKVDDLWTLTPAASAPNFSTDNTDIFFQVLESNFLGYGQKVRGRYRFRQEDGNIRHLISGSFMEPRLFGTHLGLESNYIQSRDGNSWQMSLERPFYSLATKWSSEVAVQDLVGVAKWYENGKVADEYEQSYRSEFARITRAIGGRHEQTKLSLWYNHVNSKYKLLKHISDFPSAANFENRNQQMLGISINRSKSDFIQETFLQKMGKVEDLEIGLKQGFSLGRSSKLLGSDRNETFINIFAESLNRYGTRHFLKTELEFTSNLSQSRLRGSVAKGGVGYLLRRSKNHTVASRLVGLLAFNLERGQQFILGGDNGLRGYTAKSFNSNKYLIFNLEERRIFWKHPWIVIGAAAFADLGYVESRSRSEANKTNKASDWKNFKASLGVGLRTGGPKVSDSPVFRVDLAYPFGAEAKQKRFFLFSAGQAF